MNSNVGWIYVLDDKLGHYKIGCAEKLDKRVKQLKIQLPFKVVVSYCFETTDYQRVERGLHRRFNYARLNGEWFQLIEDDFEYIWELADFSGFFEMPNGTLMEDGIMGQRDVEKQ